MWLSVIHTLAHCCEQNSTPQTSKDVHVQVFTACENAASRGKKGTFQMWLHCRYWDGEIIQVEPV